MKRSIQISTLIIFAFLVVVPPPAFSEVKISLKNGREIIADNCRDTKGKLICEKMGGTFEFDKAEIRKIENITIEHHRDQQEATPEASLSEQKKGGRNDAETSKTDGKTNAEAQTGGLTGEQEKKLSEISAKRAEFEADREKLMKEREQLREEVKAAGVFKSREKFEDTQKKINDLDARIKAFNDKVNKLNEESSSLSKEPLKKAE